MIDIKRRFDAAGYSAPECVELEVIIEGAILSASTGMGASAEGYNVDDEVFNW